MQTIQVQLPHTAYPILIGSKVRNEVPRVLAQLRGCHRLLVITDRNVERLHGAALRAVLPPATAEAVIEPGEASKSLAALEPLYDALAEARIERDDAIAAFGGGVVGDVAGFVAATWLRGVRFVQVPTTLEAAIDAAVGGKTGINHPAGKNLIGAFHQPSAVLVDVDFLATLEARDRVSALSESVKHALIRDEKFFEWHEQNAEAIRAGQADVLEELIARNCGIKADVVGRDERESGLRAILNFGHTVGHALEHVLGYALRHGECVGLGILVENRLARLRGMIDEGLERRTAELLGRLGLPATLPQRVDPAGILAACRMDKKNRHGAIHFVLLEGIGRPLRVSDVDDEQIVAALHIVQP